MIAFLVVINHPNTFRLSVNTAEAPSFAETQLSFDSIPVRVNEVSVLLTAPLTLIGLSLKL